MENASLIRDFTAFLKEQGKSWLVLPMRIFLVVGALLTPPEKSTDAPLIYPLF